MKRFIGSWMSHLRMFFALFFIALIIPSVASAQEPPPPHVGGHVGVAFPIVTRSDGRTTTISEDFIVGFPIGITIRNSSPFSFDFEFVPTVNNSPKQDVTLTVHPGVIYSFKPHYAIGLRAAFDIGADTYGFTPLVQRSWKIKGNTNYFIEADFPVRFRQQPDLRRTTSGTSPHIPVSPSKPSRRRLAHSRMRQDLPDAQDCINQPRGCIASSCQSCLNVFCFDLIVLK